MGSIGSRPQHTSHDLEERETRALRAKGWGAAKIARYLEERRKYVRRLDASYARVAGAEPDPDLTNAWVPFLRDAVEAGHASRIGIVTYDDGNPKKWKSIHQEPSLPAGDLDARQLAMLDEGKVLIVT